jgi:hypothetical protein
MLATHDEGSVSTASTSCPNTYRRPRSRTRLAEHPRDRRRRRGGDPRAQGAARPRARVHGSGVLLRWLLERDLVDELNLRIYPVVVGDGLRLFPEHGQTHNLELVESVSTASGVMLQTYRPAGRATFGNAGE